MRHTETEWNRQRVIQGHQDSPLTPRGETMALTWGQVLKSLEAEEGPFSRIVSSDLGRAVKTAERINSLLQCPFSISAGVREMDWGRWSGHVFKEIRKASTRAVRRQIHRCWKFQPPGGESRIDVLIRAMAALENIAREDQALYLTKTTDSLQIIDADHLLHQKVLVVTHGGVIRCLINYFLHRSFMWNEPDVMKPYHLHRFFYDHDADIISLKKENFLALPTDIASPTLE